MKQVFRACFLIALCAAFGLADRAKAQDYPAYTDVYVNDFGNLLTDLEETELRHALIDLFDRTGVEAVVVTMTTMKTYGHQGQIEPFATGLFNHWGVGNAARNDGVMVLVAKDDRQMRIELGAGYEPAMDRQMQQIIDREMLPAFRNGQFDQGIEDGVDALILQLRARSGQPMGLMERALDQASRGTWAVKTLVFSLLAGAGVLIFNLFQSWRRNRPRICPVDGKRMVRLDQVWEDNHLETGEIAEEALGSVEYDVWECPGCDHVTIEGYRRWLSRYGACRACGYKTMEGNSTTIRFATKTSTGLKRMNYHCYHCQHQHSVDHIIAAKGESDSGSGSGSGRSSFGGGSSSGGGASGSW
ncbi:TPM domain-containing protein [Neogemmobacter tilapiae]|uniref:TPM domain-containing protein n=1 Tax=Neogemmobacter tilapiae TaxID=875041 RepID=A0A918TJA2_9RHOB|nr:TPM domain-containing protein [Gemmobacter tilapiae]GHC51602.1 hypothetical protein GCM10007315_12530 [Gemmobacter tilapiae]